MKRLVPLPVLLPLVTPRVGVWIETHTLRQQGMRRCVTPRVGVWIETTTQEWRGGRHLVTPRVGVWIETLLKVEQVLRGLVTPRVGVWIETTMRYLSSSFKMVSLPAWECGLKHRITLIDTAIVMSLPAWECGLKRSLSEAKVIPLCHSPRGSVD